MTGFWKWTCCISAFGVLILFGAGCKSFGTSSTPRGDPAELLKDMNQNVSDSIYTNRR